MILAAGLVVQVFLAQQDVVERHALQVVLVPVVHLFAQKDVQLAVHLTALQHVVQVQQFINI